MNLIYIEYAPILILIAVALGLAIALLPCRISFPSKQVTLRNYLHMSVVSRHSRTAETHLTYVSTWWPSYSCSLI